MPDDRCRDVQTNRDVAIVDPPAPVPLPRPPFPVAFEAVRARYPGAARPALDGFSLRLDPGRRVALAGPSGAGKTTVANLLVRFLDPEVGRVTMAGRDLRGYRQEDIRRTIAVAGQVSHVFSASVRENYGWAGRTRMTGRSSAHLDPQTATELVADLLAAAGNRSVPLITHRPEGLDLVDEIVTIIPTG